jgi:hypothetical protein
MEPQTPGESESESETRDQILGLMYSFKQQGMDQISLGELLLLLGVDLEEITDDQFDIMVSLPDSSDLEAELCWARINNQIH